MRHNEFTSLTFTQNPNIFLTLTKELLSPKSYRTKVVAVLCINVISEIHGRRLYIKQGRITNRAKWATSTRPQFHCVAIGLL